MKKIAFFSLLLMLLVSACALDEEILPDGEDARDVYTGTWSVSDNALKINYVVSISKSSSNSSEVLLSNFAGSGDEAVGIVAGKTLSISSQTIGDSWMVDGTGVYKTASRLEFQYNLEIGGDSESRSAVFTK